MDEKRKKIIRFVVPLIVALISAFVVARFAASPELHSKSIKSLDEKKTTVLELTAASAGTATAITLIPGDTGTPIAEKLTDLSGYFLIILCAIFIEKYLLTITGYAAFVILIPLGCVCLSINALKEREILKKIAVKLLIFGLAIFIVVPVSVGVSSIIEKTYEDSISATIEDAEGTTDAIEKSDGQDKSWWENLKDTVTSGVSNATDKLGQVLNGFVESIAVLIATSCVIPILTLLFFVWLIKVIMGVDIKVPKIGRTYKKKVQKIKEIEG